MGKWRLKLTTLNPSHPVTREDRNDVVTAVNNLHLVRGEVYDPHFPPFKGERA